MLHVIKKKGIIFGYLITYNKNKRGVNFLTPNYLNHQVAHINHKKKHIIKPHRHFKNKRVINYTSEVLIIQKGKLRVDFYTKNEKYVFSKIIKKDQIIILINDGHGFETITPVQMIEIKQGPYNMKKDKKVFNPINLKKIKIQ
tara:strand:+ start:2720 stop:3148 length:429 start_codon:yes stop_codon:yes gene_type:complete